jgi:Asp/Glu/hydantoin racemase
VTQESTLGVIMLNTRFPRPIGDIGNPLSFSCPVIHEVAKVATAAAVVTREQIHPEVIDGFVTVARNLVRRGASMITTSCGFACAIHDQLAESIDVPLVSSSLNLVPTLVRRYGSDSPLPVITFDGTVLSARHFGRFWAPNVVIQGIENGVELHSVIKNDRLALDQEKALEDVLTAVAQVLHKHPSAKAVLLECTNLPPYRTSIEQRFGLPVHDIFSALEQRRAEALF